MTTSVRSNEALWQRIKTQVMNADIAGTRAHQWSARKATVAVQRYKKAGGRYKGPRSSNNSLHKWLSQKWRTHSGRPSRQTGERYLPSKAFAALSKSDIALINRSKRRSTRQYSRMPKRISDKVRRYRS